MFISFTAHGVETLVNLDQASKITVQYYLRNEATGHYDAVFGEAAAAGNAVRGYVVTVGAEHYHLVGEPGHPAKDALDGIYESAVRADGGGKRK